MVRLRRGAGTLLCLLSVAFSHPATAAEEQADRRMLLGLKLFPAIVAADQDLASKLSPEKEIRLVLLYRDNADGAKNAAKRLRTTTHLREYPLKVDVLPYAELASLASDPPTAIFLSEWAQDELPQVAGFGQRHHRLVFSPFKGDVKAGIQTGIFISDHILPLANANALQAAGIRLKPFLLEVAKTNE